MVTMCHSTLFSFVPEEALLVEKASGRKGMNGYFQHEHDSSLKESKKLSPLYENKLRSKLILEEMPSFGDFNFPPHFTLFPIHPSM